MKGEMSEFVQEFSQYCQSMAHQKFGFLSIELNLPLHKEKSIFCSSFQMILVFLKSRSVR